MIILYSFLTLIGVSILRALAHWRGGMMFIIFVAAIQDPMRKLVKGTPGFMVLATAPIFFALIFSSMITTRGWWGIFQRNNPTIGKSLVALVVLSLPAAAISLTYGPGSWQLTVLGTFSMSIIFLAMIAGYHYPKGRYTIRHLLGFYCIVHGIMLTGTVFEYMGWFGSWRALGDEAMGYNWIRYGSGYVVDIICGFYRSGDVMGWHAATVSCLSVILATTAKGRKRWFWAAIAGLGVVALLLCGRRKMVYMLPVFVIALAYMYWQAGRKMHKVSLLGLLAVPVISLVVIGDWMGDDDGMQVRYYTSTSDETLSSLEVHGFSSLIETYRQDGFFGAGLGSATPGIHHLKVDRPDTWQESGPSRILVELGVPGSLGFLAVVVAIIAGTWRVTVKQLKSFAPDALYSAGLVAFFIANAGSLTVSGQILADPFIALFLGMMVGLVLSTARNPAVAVAVPMPAKVATRGRPAVGLALPSRHRLT